jgi:hypothetical protein
MASENVQSAQNSSTMLPSRAQLASRDAAHEQKLASACKQALGCYGGADRCAGCRRAHEGATKSPISSFSLAEQRLA